MAGASRLVAALRATGADAFVADTAPLIYRTERRVDPKLVDACDAVFELVESGRIACLVSSVTVAEFFVGAYRKGEDAVAFADAYLRQASFAVVPPDGDVAQAAALLVARRKVRRIADALIAATANSLGLPLLTADRELARSGIARTLLVSDFV